MGRFLTIQGQPDGSARIYGPGTPQQPGQHHLDVPPPPLVADFRDGMDAQRFLSAIACAENNPGARADLMERRALYRTVIKVSGRWYVHDLTPDRLTVATFAERDDADLFIAFVRRGA